MGSILDDLFGSPDNSDQKAQNRRAQEYIEEKTAQARNDAITAFDASRRPLQMGYQSAADAKAAALLEAIKAYDTGSTGAQQILIDSMPMFQKAILGQPVDMSSLAPVSSAPSEGLGWLENLIVGERTGLHEGEELPDISAPTPEGEAPATGRTSGVQVGDTNQVAVEKLFQNGLIGEQEYNQMQTSFRNDPELANDTSWSTAGSADVLLNRDWSEVSEGYTQTLKNVFASIYA
jgi:hypothetical protein